MKISFVRGIFSLGYLGGIRWFISIIIFSKNDINFYRDSKEVSRQIREKRILCVFNLTRSNP